MSYLANNDPIRRNGPFRVMVCAITLWSFFIASLPIDLARAAETSLEPSTLGSIRDGARASQLLIHIQDAHCNYYAQHEINDIIGRLSEKHGTVTVNLEGGKGAYDLSLFTRIRDKAAREKTADYFVKEGIVNGAEYFAINNPEKAHLWGIEDTELYLENLNLYRENLKHKEKIDKELKRLSRSLSKRKLETYSKELLDFDRKSGNLEFKEYADYLYDGREGYPNIARLHELTEREKAIDFRKANVERNRLIKKLQKSLSKNSLSELAQNAGDYTYLFKKAKMLALDLSAYSELEKYRTYLEEFEAIDNFALMGEIDALEEEIRESLVTTEEEKTLVRLSKNFELVEKMLNLAITRDEYEELQKMGTASPFSALHVHIDTMAKCYEATFKRDEAFTRNLVFRNNVAVAVTGGFHAGNLEKLCRERGISYVSVMPEFTSPDGYECPYFGLLAGKTDIGETLKKGFSALAIATPLSSREFTKRVHGEGTVRALDDLKGFEGAEGQVGEADFNALGKAAEAVVEALPGIVKLIKFEEGKLIGLTKSNIKINGIKIWLVGENHSTHKNRLARCKVSGRKATVFLNIYRINYLLRILSTTNMHERERQMDSFVSASFPEVDFNAPETREKYKRAMEKCKGAHVSVEADKIHLVTRIILHDISQAYALRQGTNEAEAHTVGMMAEALNTDQPEQIHRALAPVLLARDLHQAQGTPETNGDKIKMLTRIFSGLWSKMEVLYSGVDLPHPFKEGVSIPRARDSAKATTKMVEELIPRFLLGKIATYMEDNPGFSISGGERYDPWTDTLGIGEFPIVFPHEIGHLIFAQWLFRGEERQNLEDKFWKGNFGNVESMAILDDNDVPELVKEYRELVGAVSAQSLARGLIDWEHSLNEHFAHNVERLCYGAPFLTTRNSTSGTADILAFFIKIGAIDAEAAEDYLVLSAALNGGRQAPPTRIDMTGHVDVNQVTEAYYRSKLMKRSEQLGRKLTVTEETALRLTIGPIEEDTAEVEKWLKADPEKVIKLLRSLERSNDEIEYKIRKEFVNTRLKALFNYLNTLDGLKKTRALKLLRVSMDSTPDLLQGNEVRKSGWRDKTIEMLAQGKYTGENLREMLDGANLPDRKKRGPDGYETIANELGELWSRASEGAEGKLKRMGRREDVWIEQEITAEQKQDFLKDAEDAGIVKKHGLNVRVIEDRHGHLGRDGSCWLRSGPGEYIIVLNKDNTPEINDEAIYHECREIFWRRQFWEDGRRLTQHEAHVLASADQIKLYSNQLRELTPYHASQLAQMSKAELSDIIYEEREWHRDILKRALEQFPEELPVKQPWNIEQYEIRVIKKAYKEYKMSYWDRVNKYLVDGNFKTAAALIRHVVREGRDHHNIGASHQFLKFAYRDWINGDYGNTGGRGLHELFNALMDNGLGRDIAPFVAYSMMEHLITSSDTDKAWASELAGNCTEASAAVGAAIALVEVETDFSHTDLFTAEGVKAADLNAELAECSDEDPFRTVIEILNGKLDKYVAAKPDAVVKVPWAGGKVGTPPEVRQAETAEAIAAAVHTEMPIRAIVVVEGMSDAKRKKLEEELNMGLYRNGYGASQAGTRRIGNQNHEIRLVNREKLKEEIDDARGDLPAECRNMKRVVTVFAPVGVISKEGYGEEVGIINDACSDNPADVMARYAIARLAFSSTFNKIEALTAINVFLEKITEGGEGVDSIEELFGKNFILEIVPVEWGDWKKMQKATATAV